MTSAAGLWKELCGLLHDEGLLPLDADVLTPAEVANAIAAGNGDARPRTFVWQYFYPRHYGGIEGELSDADAVSLVASFKVAPEPPPGEPAGPACGVCHQRPPQAEAIP